MKTLISFFTDDWKYANQISSLLKKNGQKVWFDFSTFPITIDGYQSIAGVADQFDSLIIIASDNAIFNRWFTDYFSSVTLDQIYKTSMIINCINVSNCNIPAYLKKFNYFDSLKNFINLYTKNNAIITSYVNKKMDYSPRYAKSTNFPIVWKGIDDYRSEIESLAHAYKEGTLSLVCGAGVSQSAGIPGWNDLLAQTLKIVIEKFPDKLSDHFSSISMPDFIEQSGLSTIIIGRILKEKLGDEFIKSIKRVLYNQNPSSSNLISAIGDLASPQRDTSHLNSIITYNFDDLLEQEFMKRNIKFKIVVHESDRAKKKEIPIFHVHGFLPRDEKVKLPEDIILSEDAYHKQIIDSFSWSNLVQINEFSQNTCLFIGISLSDPNMR